MKVFISWSGQQSRQIATALRDWLPMVIQAVDPYMSARDNEAGARWNEVVSAQLDASDFGIICLTPENLNAPWIMFEAGALSKAVDRAHVVPLLYQLTPTDVGSPLSQFMMKETDRSGVHDVVTSLNNALEKPIASESMDRLFRAVWPELEARIEQMRGSATAKLPERPDRELLEEVVELVRGQNRLLRLTELRSTQTLGSSSEAPSRSVIHDAVNVLANDFAQRYSGEYRIQGDLVSIYADIPQDFANIERIRAMGENLKRFNYRMHILESVRPALDNIDPPADEGLIAD